jgi:hypothetical protein
MHIQKVVDFVALNSQAGEGLLAGSDSWMEVAVGMHPLPVDVTATDVTTAVTV